MAFLNVWKEACIINGFGTCISYSPREFFFWERESWPIKSHLSGINLVTSRVAIYSITGHVCTRWLADKSLPSEKFRPSPKLRCNQLTFIENLLDDNLIFLWERTDTLYTSLVLQGPGSGVGGVVVWLGYEEEVWKTNQVVFVYQKKNIPPLSFYPHASHLGNLSYHNAN